MHTIYVSVFSSHPEPFRSLLECDILCWHDICLFEGFALFCSVRCWTVSNLSFLQREVREPQLIITNIQVYLLVEPALAHSLPFWRPYRPQFPSISDALSSTGKQPLGQRLGSNSACVGTKHTFCTCSNCKLLTWHSAWIGGLAVGDKSAILESLHNFLLYRLCGASCISWTGFWECFVARWTGDETMDCLQMPSTQSSCLIEMLVKCWS